VSDGKRGSVLVLGLNYAPEAIGIGPYTAGLAEHFARQGHPTTVITARPYYPQWKAVDGYSTFWSLRKENGVTVVRCPHYIPASPNGRRRLLHHASFALASLAPMFRQMFTRPDVVLCVVPSLLGLPVAWLVAKLGRAKLWIHVQDFEVEAAQATGLLAKGSPAARIGLAAERFLLRRGDLVTTISPQMCAKLSEKGVPNQRIAEMRNWANHLEAIAKADGDQIRAEWGLEEKFVALYSGNIANKQGLEILVDAARQLQGNERIAFVICGEGPNRTRLEDRARGLRNFQFHNLQPSDRFAALMRMADCHLLPQIGGAMDLVLPSKLTNMLASGRPTIATAEAGTGLAQEVQGCGIVVPPEDPSVIANAVLTLAEDNALAASLGNAASKRADERWSRPRVLAQADSLLDRLVAGEITR